MFTPKFDIGTKSMKLFELCCKRYIFHLSCWQSQDTTCIAGQNKGQYHGWQRVSSAPTSWRPPILLTPLFQILFDPNPPPLLFLFSCFFCWMLDCSIWYVNTTRTLNCFMQQVISLLRSNKWYGFLLALLFDITYTCKQRHTSYTGANILTHHINIS